MAKSKLQQKLDKAYFDNLNAQNIAFIEGVISEYIYDGSKVKIIQLVLDKHTILLNKIKENTNTKKYNKLLNELAEKVAIDYDPKYL